MEKLGETPKFFSRKKKKKGESQFQQDDEQYDDDDVFRNSHCVKTVCRGVVGQKILKGAKKNFKNLKFTCIIKGLELNEDIMILGLQLIKWIKSNMFYEVINNIYDAI